jgi:hypothetical protein
MVVLFFGLPKAGLFGRIGLNAAGARIRRRENQGWGVIAA